MLVSKILETKPKTGVVSVHPHSLVGDAAKLLADKGIGTVVVSSDGKAAVGVLTMMTEGRFRHMPVMEAGAMIGLISIGDVVKARLAELAMEKDALEGMIMGH